MAKAGTSHSLTLADIRRAIKELGYLARQRNVHYQLVDVQREARAIEVNTARRGHG